jgi:Ni,Fe-hydrogenase I cytochrome b subunit
VDEVLALSPEGRTTAGILLLSIVIVESGGLYMLQIVRRRVDLTGFQQAFARAGHAHAGVLVIFSLVCQFLADNVTLDQPLATIARTGVPLAAILMPTGFFLSSSGQGRTQPNVLIWLVYLGALFLTAGVVTLGFGLLAS